MRKNHWISLSIALLVSALLVCLEQRRGKYFLEKPPEVAAPVRPSDYNLAFIMQRAEWATYDLRFKIQGNREPHKDIAIIAIDEKSLQELHQWPWPRQIHANL